MASKKYANHKKSQEWFKRAVDVIPSGIYGHLGPAEGLWLPTTNIILNNLINLHQQIKLLVKRN